MTEPMLTPSRLWRRMTADQRMQAARAFWLDDQMPDDQVQAAVLIAQQKKFRAKTVVRLDAERKARHLATVTGLPDALAARVLVAYHLASQRPMMGAFLDSLGIAHEEGLIKDDEVKPDPAKLGPAVSDLAKSYSPENVAL